MLGKGFSKYCGILNEHYPVSHSAKILLLDDRFELASLEDWKGEGYHAVVCLFWVAPSTKLFLSQKINGSCYGLADIVGSDYDLGKYAYDLARQIVEDGSCYGDLYWRTYLMERLYQECHILASLILALEFVEKLRKEWAISNVAIHGVLSEELVSLLSRVMTKYPGLSYRDLGYRLEFHETRRDKNSISRRLSEWVREVCLTGDWRNHAIELVEWADKKHRLRTHVGRWMAHSKVPKGGITFFSSYLNNSRTLSSFIDLIPHPVHWVLTNNSSRRGIREGSNTYSWIWQFARQRGCGQEVETGGLYKDGLDSKEYDSVRAWTKINPTWRNWESVERSLLGTLTQCWESYLQEAEPRLIVMANQWGIEGWFTQIARRRNIPVLQLLHGALGGYLYTRTPILSDLMVVPGEFWRNLWPPELQHRILVCNPADSIMVNKKKKALQRQVLTFFSWPLSLIPFYSQSELVDGLIHIFHELISQRMCNIIFRAHPQENPSVFVQRWARMYGSLPPEIQVSKNEPLSQVLSETSIALMFRSTVMLDCLANNTPVIMPGWIDFAWNRALDGLPNVFLAPDFPDLQRRLMEWLNQPPRTVEELPNLFLAPAGRGIETFVSALQNLLSPKIASDDLHNTVSTIPEYKQSCSLP